MKVFICRKLFTGFLLILVDSSSWRRLLVRNLKYKYKSIKDKYNALKEVEDGKTKSQVAAKYGIPKNTLSTWLKYKDKIFEATKKGSNSKRQRLRQDTFANLDEAMLKWLLVVRSRDEAVSALVFKTKATEFAEKMNVENSKVSDGWLDRWKKRFNVSFKTVSGESNACTNEMVAPW